MKEFTQEKTLRIAITDKALDTMYDYCNWNLLAGAEFDWAVWAAVDEWVASFDCEIDDDELVFFYEDIVEMLKVWIQVRDAE